MKRQIFLITATILFTFLPLAHAGDTVMPKEALFISLIMLGTIPVVIFGGYRIKNSDELTPTFWLLSTIWILGVISFSSCALVL